MAKFKTSWFCGWEDLGRDPLNQIIKCQTEFDMGQVSTYQHNIIAPEGTSANLGNAVYFRNTNMFVRIHPDDWERFEREFKAYRESRGDEFRESEPEPDIVVDPELTPV